MPPFAIERAVFVLYYETCQMFIGQNVHVANFPPCCNLFTTNFGIMTIKNAILPPLRSI